MLWLGADFLFTCFCGNGRFSRPSKGSIGANWHWRSECTEDYLARWNAPVSNVVFILNHQVARFLWHFSAAIPAKPDSKRGPPVLQSKMAYLTAIDPVKLLSYSEV